MTQLHETVMVPVPNLKSVLARRHHPLSVFERLAVAENYEFERADPDELHICISGKWANHDLALAWNGQTEKLSIYLPFDGRLPGGRRDEICRLLSLINERLPSGHFDFWDKNVAMVYRNSHSLCGGARLLTEQAMDLLATAIEAAERAYPALQYVVWAGKSAEDALTHALMDLAVG